MGNFITIETKEKLIKAFLFSCATITLLTTLGIIWVLLSQSVSFFKEVSIIDFLTDKEWTPLFSEKHFGILPLLSGTLLTTFIALLVALPLGLSIAVYLNEYAPKGFRKVVKPLLEILAAVPTVVYGFFALVVVTPFLQSFLQSMLSVILDINAYLDITEAEKIIATWPSISGFNSLSAGIVMGIMIIPFISSLGEDALFAVPNSLRQASYGMGATRLQTAFRVLIPSASSGIIASIILAFSRAIGETMIVAVAAGQQPQLTMDPTVPIQTITSYIVQVSSGDVQHGSLEYNTIFAAGLALFVFTFILNNISFWVNKKFRQEYE